MSKAKRSTIEVQGASVAVLSQNQQDLISLTDIARFKNPKRSDDLVRNWLRNRNTVEFLGIWEKLHNLAFNSVEFDGIKSRAGLNSFVARCPRLLSRQHDMTFYTPPAPPARLATLPIIRSILAWKRLLPKGRLLGHREP